MSDSPNCEKGRPTLPSFLSTLVRLVSREIDPLALLFTLPLFLKNKITQRELVLTQEIIKKGLHSPNSPFSFVYGYFSHSLANDIFVNGFPRVLLLKRASVVTKSSSSSVPFKQTARGGKKKARVFF